MNQVEERLKIAKLIAKELTETLSQEERDTLVLWKEEKREDLHYSLLQQKYRYLQQR